MKRKLLMRSVSVALTLMMIVLASLTTIVTLSAASSTTPTIAFTNPAIPANAGETVDLSKYAAELKAGTVAAADKITWSSSDLTISGGKVTPSAKGVYKLSATDGTNTKTIYLVVKNASDSEYVLYENDFSNADTISDFTLDKTGAATSFEISNGKFVLDTTADKYAGGRVLLPEWLGDFGNYNISSKATITSCKDNDGSRWMAVMYRFQPTDSKPNWYQMAVRQNASSDNGVEISYRKPDGNWDVMHKKAHSSSISSSTYYSLEIEVANKSISQKLNGTDAGSLSASLSHIQTGRVGLGGAGCVASFDDIKITVNLEAIKPTSGITLTPTMAYEIKDNASLDNIFTNTPDVAIITMNASGNVVCADQSTIGSLSDVVAKIKGKIIPAIKLDDGCSAATASAKINALGTKDLMIISDDASDITTIRKTNSRVVGVLDLTGTDLSNKKTWEIRAMVLKCGARICILPANMADQHFVSSLNTMGVTVWFTAEENARVEMFDLITSGANGIVTADRALMSDTLLSPIFKENSIIRPIGVIGHRGTPALAPELCIAGSSLAAQKGANIIENDLYITTDGVVVVSHDNTVATITNGSGNVEEHDLAWFKQWMIDDKPDLNNLPGDAITTEQPVATLEDYFKCFKDTDTFMFLEIKSGQSERIVMAMKALIDKYDIADQCGVISFGDANLQAVRKYMPELSVGKLTAPLGGVDAVANKVTYLESSYNPDGNSSFIDVGIVRGLANRGIFTWPWTINSSEKFDQYMLTGVGGITSDHSYYAGDYYRHLYTDKKEYEFKPGESASISLITEFYASEKDDPTFANVLGGASRAEMILLEGNESVTYANGKLSATEKGEAWALFRIDYKLNNGTKVYIYSQPVYIGVGIEKPVDPTTPDEPTPTEPIVEPEPTEPAKKKGCGSTITATSALIAVMSVGTAVVIKRKKENR